MPVRFRLRIGILTCWCALSSPVWAQETTALAAASAGATSLLGRLLDHAWALQPESRSLATRRSAAEAQRRIADGWTPEPAAIELSGRSDRFTGHDGALEIQAGVAIPLWLPRQQERTARQADAESELLLRRVEAARWKTAGQVREAFWAWQRAVAEQGLAAGRLENAKGLAADASRRLAAGDLARLDLVQAEGQVAGARSALAEAASAQATAVRQLREWLGSDALPVVGGAEAVEDTFELPSESLPDPADAPTGRDDRHPALREWVAKASVADSAAALARVQGRASPELTLAAVRERGMSGAAYQHSLIAGIRLPLSSDDRQRARLGIADADAIDARAQLELERLRIDADIGAARERLAQARALLTAALERRQLAVRARNYARAAFRQGESDLATRLRIELEATEAERQVVRARIEQAAGVSALRQAHGLLPE